VQLRGEDPRLAVYFSTEDAAAAASDRPEDEFYDARGIRLKRVQEGHGPRLEAGGEANQVKVRERLMDELRRAAKLAVAAGEDAAEMEASLCWLEGAPSLEYMIHGLTLAPLDYDEDVNPPGPGIPFPVHDRCNHCSWIQKFLGTGHNCC
jgi:hypothetical protein